MNTRLDHSTVSPTGEPFGRPSADAPLSGESAPRLATPGPWHYHARLSGSENHRGFRVFGGADDWMLAEVIPVDEDGMEGEANARLMALAPDLHEFAQAALMARAWFEGDPEGALNEIEVRARAVLARPE